MDESVELLKKAVALAPGKFSCHYNLGLALARKDEFFKAIDVFKRAININSRDGRLYFHLAGLYDKTDQPKKAIKYYKVLINSNHPQKDNFVKRVYELENKIYK